MSYATAAALESASTAPPSYSEELKAPQTTVATLREENSKLKSDTRDMAGKLRAAEASREEFPPQVSNLKEVNTIKQDKIVSL